MIFEPIEPYRASEFQVKFATSDWERQQAHALRRAVFCDEQRIFDGDDRDATDDTAIPIVALSMMGVAADRLVGTVRIQEPEPGVWWGSR
ncbi:histone acetyltransferase, partial [Rhizobium sp. TRM95111]|uniref:MSMEG_0567/Sll0786 family nitrogen starvation N-acetyltransferase n=1 Tax=Rhizobium alarense TaxID=2846851 RepID=UPI002E3303D8